MAVKEINRKYFDIRFWPIYIAFHVIYLLRVHEWFVFRTWKVSGGWQSKKKTFFPQFLPSQWGFSIGNSIVFIHRLIEQLHVVRESNLSYFRFNQMLLNVLPTKHVLKQKTPSYGRWKKIKSKSGGEQINRYNRNNIYST